MVVSLGLEGGPPTCVVVPMAWSWGVAVVAPQDPLLGGGPPARTVFVCSVLVRWYALRTAVPENGEWVCQGSEGGTPSFLLSLGF